MRRGTFADIKIRLSCALLALGFVAAGCANEFNADPKQKPGPDVTAPDMLGVWSLTNPLNGSISNVTAPQIQTFGIEEGSVIKVFTDDLCLNLVGSATITVAGMINLNLNTLFGDGLKTFYHTVTDQKGNASACVTTGLSYTLDTTPPPAPSFVTRLTPSASPYTATTPSFQVGGVSAGLLVKLYADAACTIPALKGSATAAGTTADITSSALTTDALYAFHATATDAAGNESACSSASAAYTLDRRAPAGLSYPSSSYTFTKTVAITPFAPSSAAGPVESYSVAPPLPAGLALNTVTGVITGTPTVLSPTATYTVTAANVAGSTGVNFSITVVDVAPAGLTYSANPATYVVGSLITPNTPSLSGGGPVISYSVSPPLPAGLNLDDTNGAITGTPTAITSTATYTVTAANSGGSTSAGVSITVNDIPPAGLTYSTNPATYVVGSTITPNTPSSSGGAVVSYSVAPPLPTGLSLNTSTGIISGVPTVSAATAPYTVTATNTGGSTTANVSITVIGPAVLTIGAASIPNTPVGATSSPVTFTVTNSGGADATLSTRSLATGSQFAISGGTCTVSSTVAANSGTCTILVTFSPTSTGTKNDTINLGYFDGASAQTATRAISAVGDTPASLSIASATIPDTPVGSTSSPVTFTVTNSGGTAATINSRSLTTGSDFSITGGTCSTSSSVAANGGTCTILVTFTPTGAGAKNDTINLGYFDGAANQTATRAISANGATPALLAIDNPSIPNTSVGSTSSTVTFTVTNSGGTNATVNSRTLTTGTQFSITGGSCTVASSVAAGGGTCTIDLVFAPTSPGTKNDTLNLGYFDGAASQTATRAISGAAGSPASLTIAAATIPDTTVGATSAPVTFTVTNSGQTAGTINSLSLTTGTQFTIGAGGTCTPTSTVAASGGTCTILVTFSPTSTGTKNDTINLSYFDGAANQTTTRAISGNGTGPAVLSIASATIPDTPVGATSSPVTFTVTNSGSSPATVNSRTLTTGTQFAIGSAVSGGTCTVSSTVAAGGTCTILVTFSPTSTGAKNDTINLGYFDGAANQTATRAISGNGLGPASLAIAAATIPDTTVGATSGAVTFTVTNSGGTAATINARSLTTGTQFAISGGTCTVSSTVAATGGTCTLLVTFSPTSTGAKNDTLNLDYFDGAANQTATRAISGNGVTPASLAIAAATIPDTTVGSTSSAVTFTVTNSGQSPATISSRSLTTGSQFAISGGTCAVSSTVAAGGGTCTILVTFSPTSTGAKNDTINLGYNDGAAAQTATRAITGNGITPASLSIASATIPDTAAGATSSAVTFTVTNSGQSPATVSSRSLTTGSQFAISGGTCTVSSTVTAGGGTCTILVTFSPTSTGVKNDTINLGYFDGAAAQTATRAITGTGLAVASLSIAAAAIPDTTVGASSSAVTFTVTNSGGATATINSRTLATGTQYSISGGTCTVSSAVAAGATCTIDVVFSPTSSGTKSDTINLGYYNGASNQTATRAISGNALGPASLTIAAATIPDTTVGSTSSAVTFTVTNSGGTAATISSRTLTTGTQFAISGGTCTVSSTVTAGGGTCTISVTFSPTSTGAKNDTINLGYFNGASAQTATRAISGNGLGPASLAIAAATIPDTTVGATSSAVTFNVTNSGGTDATISSRTLTTGTQFTISGGTCAVSSTVTAGGGTCTILVTFAPTTTGLKNDTINLGYFDGAAAQTATRAISASGLTVASLAISNSGAFGNVYVGTTADATFTITNSGQSSATVMAAGTPALAAPFAFKGGTGYPGTGGTCGASLAGNSATCTVVVRYSPTALVSSSDTLRIAYNDGLAAQAATQSVSGTGIPAPPTHLAISGSASVYSATCTAFVVHAQDNVGTDSNVSASEAVTVTTDSATGRFYTDSSCTTPAGGTGSFASSIASGSSTKTFYYIDSVTGSYAFNATGTALADASTFNFTVGSGPPAKLVLSGATTAIAGLCSGVITVTTEDASNNVTAVSSDTAVALAGGGNGLFYSDVNCSTPITAVTIAASGNSASFYFKDNIEQSLTLTADSTPLTQGTLGFTVTAPVLAPTLSSVAVSASVVPSDGAALTYITVIPRNTVNLPMGGGLTVNVTSSSSNVTMTGPGSCGANCVVATDQGGGTYTVTATSNVAATAATFTATVLGSPNTTLPQTPSATFDTGQFIVYTSSTTGSNGPGGCTWVTGTTITSAKAGCNLYFNATSGGPTFTFDSTTEGQSFGHIFVRYSGAATGVTLTHTAITPASPMVVRKFEINAASLTLLNGSINADAKGYIYSTGAYSFASGGGGTALGSTGSAGGSHGGKGSLYAGQALGTPGPTYDSYRNPKYPGGSGGGSGGTPGGGVIRVTSTGGCILQSGSSISANGGSTAPAGAGGSVYLSCAMIGGSASSNVISASGVVASLTSYGGGGRVALLSTGDAASFFGPGLRFPSDATTLTNFKAAVAAAGGQHTSSATYGSGAAGTIYLKHSGLIAGALLVDNKGYSGQNSPGVTTFLPSLAGTVNGTPSGTYLPVSVTSSPALDANYTDLYAGMLLRPDLSFTNATPSDWSDDNVLKVSANTGTSLTTSTPVPAGVASGTPFRSIDVLDYLEIGGGAVLETNGDLYVRSGSLSSPGTTTLALTNAIITTTAAASTNLTITNSTLSSGYLFLPPTIIHPITISGASVQTPAATSTKNVTISSGSLNDAQTLNINGNFQMSGGSVVEKATTTTTTYPTLFNITGTFTLDGGTINANGKGYTAGYSYGPNGPSTALAPTNGAGGSHGGRGGRVSDYNSGATSNIGPTYDDYRNPSLPGGGGASFGNGGGVVRITATGACNINGTAKITANGMYGSIPYYGAGGSVYLSCASLGGNAGTDAVTANGGTDANDYRSAGGGGRIALIVGGDATAYSGSFAYPNNAAKLATFKATVKAKGGIGSSYGGSGAAGTIYLKHSGLMYGALLVDNGTNTTAINAGSTTFLPSLYGTINGSPSGTTLPISVTSSPALSSTAYNNLYAGMRLRPDLSFNNATASDPTDDNVLTVTANDYGSGALTLTTTSTISGVTSGVDFRTIDILDQLEVGGGAVLESNGDIYVLNGSPTNPGISTQALTNAALAFNGGAGINWTISGMTFNSNISMLLPSGSIFGYASSGPLTLTSGTIDASPIASLTYPSLTMPTYVTFYVNNLNLTAGDLTMTAGYLKATQNITVNGKINLNGGSPSLYANQTISATGDVILTGSANYINANTLTTSGNFTSTSPAGSITVPNITVSGNFSSIPTASSSQTFTVPAPTNTAYSPLIMNIGGTFTLDNSLTIDVSNMGYRSGYSYGPSGPATALAPTNNGGGSHGGKGGYKTSGGSPTDAGPTYDDYRNPSLPGAGGQSGGNGGGVARITAGGLCTLNGSPKIKANGGNFAAAGGSIYMNCAGFAGSTSLELTANGGQANINAGGGGGRIALISTGDSSSFTGGFVLPTTSSNMTLFRSRVHADGGSNGGAGGTVFIKHSGLAYGSMIVSQDGFGSGFLVGTTFLPSLAGTVSSAPGSNTLPVTVTSSPALASAAYNNLYAGMRLRPNLSFNNATASDPTDDNVLTVTANDYGSGAPTLTTSGTIAGVPSGADFRTIDIFDQLEVINAIVESNGDIYVLNGKFTDPGNATPVLSGFFKFNGSAGMNWTASAYDFVSNASWYYDPNFPSAFSVPVTFSSGSVYANSFSAPSVTCTSGTLYSNSIATTGSFTLSNCSVYTDTFNVGGDLTQTGGYIRELSTSAAALNKLQISVGGNFSTAGTIYANTLGFPNSKSYGSAGPTTALASTNNAGGSHGGRGGYKTATGVAANAGPTYDDYRDPALPGAGASSYGGGVIRLTAAGSCTLNTGTVISANGANGSAGGSVMLKCDSIGGTGGTSSIIADGGDDSTPSGGGGGRIALITTGAGGASSFADNFAFPTTASMVSSLKTRVHANGGAYGGGGGTVFLKHSALTYGALLISNSGGGNSTNSAGSTFLPSLAGTVSSATSGTGSTLPVTVTSTPALNSNYTNLYAGLRVRPDLSYTAGTTSNPTDDNVLTVTSNNDTSLTTTATVPAIPAGNSFRSIDILDYFEPNSIVETNGDIYVLGGMLSNPGTLSQNLTGYLQLNGSATQNFTITGYNFNSGVGYYYSLPSTLPVPVTITGGTTFLNSLSVPALTLNSGTLRLADLTITNDLALSTGTVYADSITAGGNISMATTSRIYPQSDSTTLNKQLVITAGGSFSMSGSGTKISTVANGYPPAKSYGPTAPSTALASTNSAGGSHGGRGGFKDTGSASNVGPTYDDYKNPSLPGGGCAAGYAGGGAVRITASGACTLDGNSSIVADGQTYCGAGGSVYMNCASFGGTSTASPLVSANGGDAYSSTYAAGGGGRIALISTAAGGTATFTGSFAYPTDSTKLATFKTKVQARGGAKQTYGGGGAGTVYLSYAGLSDGDLIIDNNKTSAGLSAYDGWTDLASATDNGSVVYTSVPAATPNVDTIQITASGTPFANMLDLFKGYLLHVFRTVDTPNPAAVDGSQYAGTVSANAANTITISTATFPSISNNYYYRFLHKLNHLEIGGYTTVKLNGADLWLTTGCDLHSASATTFDVPTGSSVTGNTFSKTTCNTVTTTGTTVLFTNTY